MNRRGCSFRTDDVRVPAVLSPLAALVFLASAACGSAEESNQAVSADQGSTTSVQVLAVSLQAALSGAGEAPLPGDPDGSGRAIVTVDASKLEVCAEVTVVRIDTPVGMHVHEGVAGSSGPVVIPLPTPKAGDGITTGCAPAGKELLDRIAADPGSFYVNVHTEPFPQGAVRAQLVRTATAGAPAPIVAADTSAAPTTATANRSVSPPTTVVPRASVAPQQVPSASTVAPTTAVLPTTPSSVAVAPATSAAPPMSSSPTTVPCDYPPCY